MSNASLRERFKIADKNAAMVSRIIKDTYEAGLIKEEDDKKAELKAEAEQLRTALDKSINTFQTEIAKETK